MSEGQKNSLNPLFHGRPISPGGVRPRIFFGRIGSIPGSWWWCGDPTKRWFGGESPRDAFERWSFNERMGAA